MPKIHHVGGPVSRPPRYRIGVVGLGMAGAAVAGLLAKQGHEVVVWEQAPRIGPIGAGILLMPSGQRILRAMNLLDVLSPKVASIALLDARLPNDRTLIRMPFALAGPDCFAMGVHRADLFETLYDNARLNGVKISLDMQVHRIFPDNPPPPSSVPTVFVTDQHGCNHGPFHFLVACDGSRSRLRRLSGLETFREHSTHGALWAIGKSAAVENRLYQKVQGSHVLLGMLPTGLGRCSFFWGQPAQTWPDLKARGFAAFRDQVLAFCPLAEDLFQSWSSWDDFIFTTYSYAIMRRRYNDTAIFLGDAAHPMSPHLGQGVNLALVDAYRFVRILETSPNYAVAFERFQSDRSTHLNYYATLTYLLSPFFQSDAPILGWGRDIALPVLSRTPWVRTQMAVTMAGLKGGWFSGPRDFSA